MEEDCHYCSLVRLAYKEQEGGEEVQGKKKIHSYDLRFSGFGYDSVKLRADELPLLIGEIARHQQGLTEQPLRIELGTPVTSRQQSVRRGGVPIHRGSSLAPPPITVPQYLVQDIDNNNIGDIGCEYLSSASWQQLQ
jgi:hypothetical protein